MHLTIEKRKKKIERSRFWCQNIIPKKYLALYGVLEI